MGFYTLRVPVTISRATTIFCDFKKTGSFVHKLCDGPSRLITNGLSDNQPVVRDGVLIHNGIVVNDDQVWSNISQTRQYRMILRRF